MVPACNRADNRWDHQKDSPGWGEMMWNSLALQQKDQEPSTTGKQKYYFEPLYRWY